jgi:phosphoribosylanthranilate isomerase
VADGGRTLRVKICGLRRREDVLVADDAGADYVGVVLTEGFSRSVPIGDVPALAEGVRAARVAVLVDETPEGAMAKAEALGAKVLQLHGSEPVEVVRELAESGRWTIWKSVRVRGSGDIDRAVELYGGLVQGLLVEGWKEGIVGGGGAILDPRSFPEVRARVPDGIDVILAGGLDPDTVGGAVARFLPDVVDVSSGVEIDVGRKSHHRVRLFIERAHAAPRGRPGGVRTDTSEGRSAGS